MSCAQKETQGKYSLGLRLHHIVMGNGYFFAFHSSNMAW